MTARILIIEDDEPLGIQLVHHVRAAGFEPAWLKEGRPLSDEDLQDVALVVLDLMLPGQHGFDVLKELRTHSDVPVLVLSARNETVDKVRGLRLGADDYLTKPFWPEEFVERMRARMRRPVLQRGGGMEFGPLGVDREARRITMHGQPVALTPVEFEILLCLCERPGAAIARSHLLERAMDPEGESDPRSLDAHVSRLRRKLGADNPVETVWGIGYRLRSEAART